MPFCGRPRGQLAGVLLVEHLGRHVVQADHRRDPDHRPPLGVGRRRAVQGRRAG